MGLFSAPKATSIRSYLARKSGDEMKGEIMTPTLQGMNIFSPDLKRNWQREDEEEGKSFLFFDKRGLIVWE